MFRFDNEAKCEDTLSTSPPQSSLSNPSINMSHTGGGLAQMSYHSNNHFDSGLGMPGSGFASRRGGNQVFNNRMSMAPPSNISTIQETQQANIGHTPRTSRSHMLAGLRTAPKSATYPGSAPPVQDRHPSPPTAQVNRQNTHPGVPQTAYGSSFGNAQRGVAVDKSMYGLPEILAPPELQFEQEQDLSDMDPQEYALLMHQAQQLAQQQAMLQQQLRQLTMAQQQMQNLSLGGNVNQQQQLQQQQLLQSQMLGAGSYYNQQLQTGMQPIVTPVPGTPGVYTVYNPITGQQKVMVNEQEQVQAQPTQITNSELSHSPPPTTPTFHAQVSPPPESNAPVQTFRSPSPPKTRSPPVEVTPLPPPSSTAFRRGHSKQLSSVTGGANSAEGFMGGVPRTASFPLTPQTGTFGPGQARIGDHPSRQPRGPPSLEELKDKPTSKYEGSKNFATRQRRRALNSLVRAGVERRGASRGSNSIDSPLTGTPSSEIEGITFSVSSESDNESGRSSRGSIHGAIGSERKTKKDSKVFDNSLTVASLSSEEGLGGKMVEIKVDEVKPANPMLVLTSATEKRKSAIF